MVGPDPERLAWLKRRREGVGASDVAAILNLSPWASPWSVFADKCGLLPLDELDDEATSFGRRAERFVTEWFEEETGLYVVGAQTEAQHPDHPHHRATLDGLVVEGPGSTDADAFGVLEIKTAGPGRPWAEVPVHYVAQIQWQLHVTGLDRAWCAALLGRRLDVHEVERDDADIAFMVAEVDRFWHEHVLTGDPPPTDAHEATLAALGEVYADVVPDTVVALDHLADTLAALADAKARKSAAEKAERAAKAEILAALGEAEAGTVDGAVVLTAKAQTRRGLDVERLRADLPDVAETYTTETTSRVLRPRKPKGSK